MLLEYIILLLFASVNSGVDFSRIKICSTVDKEKIFFHSDWTNKKCCVKIEHSRGRGKNQHTKGAIQRLIHTCTIRTDWDADRTPRFVVRGCVGLFLFFLRIEVLDFSLV